MYNFNEDICITEMSVEIIYWTLLALMILPALDYFLGLYVLPNVKPSKDFDASFSIDQISVSAIIACHNESSNIERKVHEVRDQLISAVVADFEIIVISDGSTDGSVDILQNLENKDIIKFINVTERTGKPNALNLGIAASKFQFLLFSDVRQSFSKDAITSLLSSFADPQIGAATSMLVLEGNSSPARSWMNGLKLRESLKGSTTGMCGALYIMRRELTQHMPENTILDDLLMAVYVMKNGKRVVLEPDAIVYDVPFDKFYSNRRQGRITAGLIQLLRDQWSNVKQIGLLQLLFLYGQKFLKYTAPVLFALCSIAALFSPQLTTWHYSISLILLATITLIKPLFLAQAIRLTLSYMAQLLKLDKYTKVKWEK